MANREWLDGLGPTGGLSASVLAPFDEYWRASRQWHAKGESRFSARL